MNPSLRFLILLASLLLASNSHAQVVLRLAGAVSLKDVVFKSLHDFFGADLASANYDNSTRPIAANRMTLRGQMKSLFGQQSVTVFVTYNGSGPAIQSLTQNSPVPFFASATQGDTNLVNAPADLGFSVVFQRDYPYPRPILNDEIYGVTPTIFVKSAQAPASLTNITSQQCRLLAANGSVPQHVFTGNTNDTDLIYWIMRDIGAAHRVISTREAGFTGAALAYVNRGNGWILDPVGQPTWPTIVGMINGTFGPCVTFLPPPEAAAVPPENILRFNGHLPFTGTYSSVSNNFAPVISGQYTCWGFEHILTRPTQSPSVAHFTAALKAALQTNMESSPYSIPLHRMRATRSSTGGVVTPE